MKAKRIVFGQDRQCSTNPNQFYSLSIGFGKVMDTFQNQKESLNLFYRNNSHGKKRIKDTRYTWC